MLFLKMSLTPPKLLLYDGINLSGKVFCLSFSSVNLQWILQTAPFSFFHNKVLKVCSFKSSFSSAYPVETLFCTGTLESHPLMLQTMALKTRWGEVRQFPTPTPDSQIPPDPCSCEKLSLELCSNSSQEFWHTRTTPQSWLQLMETAQYLHDLIKLQ